MVVELYCSGQFVKKLSSEYDVSEVTAYKWIKIYFPITSVDEDEMTLEDLKQMEKENIRSVILKKDKPHSSKSTVEERTNLLEQDFSTTIINEKWVADITYVHTHKDGWCYLASVIDLYSKNC